VGNIAQSPFAQVTRGKSVSVKLDRKVRYQLDGGDREKVKKFTVEVEPSSVQVRVPAAGSG
jgi:diacylglycerol kinase family enzyme